jgi:hypothetical protein
VLAEPVGFSVCYFELAGDNIGRTRAFFALSDLEFYPLPLLECGVAFCLDFRVMNKQIFCAAIRCDKSKAFLPVKPFYCTCTHYLAPLANDRP